LKAIRRNSSERGHHVNIKDRATKRHSLTRGEANALDPTALGIIKVRPQSHRPALSESGEDSDYSSHGDRDQDEGLEIASSPGGFALGITDVQQRPTPPGHAIANARPPARVRKTEDSDDDGELSMASSVASLSLAHFLQEEDSDSDSDCSSNAQILFT
jgi:hypothetical protein